MITINPPPSQHVFPVLDFKFQNTGHAAAVLWKFSIVVEDIKIDPQPSLSAWVKFISTARLSTSITNNGWGAAVNCELTLSSPVLDALFTAGARQAIVNIPAG